MLIYELLICARASDYTSCVLRSLHLIDIPGRVVWEARDYTHRDGDDGDGRVALSAFIPLYTFMSDGFPLGIVDYNLKMLTF